MGVIFWFSAQPKEALNFGQSTLVSKLAHVTEYAILGWLIQQARSGCNMQRVGWQSWLIAVLYAVTDEFHQSFTPGRTPAVTDMMIDSFGAAMGVGLAVWRS
jgi:VanZ family protein